MVFVAIVTGAFAFLALRDRSDAFIGVGAFAYPALLWLFARTLARATPPKTRALVADARGPRLVDRCCVVAATLLLTGIPSVRVGASVNTMRNLVVDECRAVSGSRTRFIGGRFGGRSYE